MKKLIISTLLAGTTALAANSALALDPCKYSAGVELGWGAIDKTTYNTNFKKLTTGGLEDTGFDQTLNKYTTQKGFPNVGVRLGYNVNSYMQVGLNLLYTNKMEFEGDLNGGHISTREQFVNVLARAHFYSPETVTGTALFTGPSLGWQNSRMNIKLGESSGSENIVTAHDLPRKNNFVFGWDLGVAQSIGRSGTSVEIIATVLADMQKKYSKDDIKANVVVGNSNYSKLFMDQKIRPMARIGLAVKQSF